jgi:hypothetical protein
MSTKTTHSSPVGHIETNYVLVTRDHGNFPLEATMDTAYPYALIKDWHEDNSGVPYETAELRTVHHDEWAENPLEWNDDITLVVTRQSRSLSLKPEDHYSYELAGVIDAYDEAMTEHKEGCAEHTIYREIESMCAYYDEAIDVYVLWGLIKNTGFNPDRRAEVIQNYLDGRGGNLTYREFSFPGLSQGDWVEGYAVTEVTHDPVTYVDSRLDMWDAWRTNNMHRIESATYERLDGQTDWTLVDGSDTLESGVMYDDIDEALTAKY